MEYNVKKYAKNVNLLVKFTCGNCSKENIQNVSLRDLVDIDYGWENELARLETLDTECICDYCKSEQNVGWSL